MGHAAAEHGQGQERPHQPSVGNDVATSRAALAGEQEHLVDPREVDDGRELRVVEERRAAVVDGAHAADRDPAREQAAEARR